VIKSRKYQRGLDKRSILFVFVAITRAGAFTRQGVKSFKKVRSIVWGEKSWSLAPAFALEV
jgi:hypothetical protein